MNSEKRFIVAVAFSFLVLLLYPVYLKWVSPPQVSTSASVEQTVPAGSAESGGQPSSHTDALASLKAPAEEHLYQFSNPFFDVEFSDLGATVTKLRLKSWGKKKKGDVLLIDRGASDAQAFLAEVSAQGIDFERARFSLVKLDQETGEVIFRFEEAEKWRLEKRFRFESARPATTLDLEAQNLSAGPLTASLELTTELFTDDEHGRDRIQTHSFVAFSDKLVSADHNKLEKKPFVSEGVINWQALTKKYLTIVVQPDRPANFSKSFTDGKGALSIRNTLRFAPEEVPSGGVLKREFLIYAGPQYHTDLKSFGHGWEQILSHGFFGVFKLWLLRSIQWAHRATGNYGWAIILITCAIKLLFTPFTHMSFESMKKMQALGPKMKALQDRHKNDQAKLSQETMALYKKHKVNPLGGCLPMLLQIPVFIAFYQVLAETAELRGEPFIFWIRDLSAQDRAFTLPFVIPFLGDAVNILPLLMLGSMVWQQKLTPASGPPEQQKMMMIMPVVFGFIFYSLPSGLVLYWFVNNMLSIFHQLFVKGKALPHHEE